jgi:hypothetical protein
MDWMEASRSLELERLYKLQELLAEFVDNGHPEARAVLETVIVAVDEQERKDEAYYASFK